MTKRVGDTGEVRAHAAGEPQAHVCYTADVSIEEAAKGRGQSLHKGQMGPTVQRVQQALKDAGFAIEADSKFGRHTDEAVRAFQRQHHLTPDGRVGPQTLAALGLLDTTTADRDRSDPSRRDGERAAGTAETRVANPPGLDEPSIGAGRTPPRHRPDRTSAPRTRPNRMATPAGQEGAGAANGLVRTRPNRSTPTEQEGAGAADGLVRTRPNRSTPTEQEGAGAADGLVRTRPNRSTPTEQEGAGAANGLVRTRPNRSTPATTGATEGEATAAIAGIDPPPHAESVRLSQGVEIGKDATPYARRAVEIAMSQLGVYGGDSEVSVYTGGINENWCKAFVVWAYSQSGESIFKTPADAWKQDHKTEQHVMGDYQKRFNGKSGTPRGYRGGNAGEPEAYTVNGTKQYRFKPYSPADGDLLVRRPLPYKPKVGDMIDIVGSSGNGHSVMVVNTDNWPMITTIEGNTLELQRAKAEGRTDILNQKGSRGGMVAIQQHDMRKTPVITVWDMSLSEKPKEE